MSVLDHAIQRKDGKFLGSGSNGLTEYCGTKVATDEGLAWHDEINQDVLKASKAGADVQFKHLGKRINLTEARVVKF